ncbi:hypothetical protein ACJDU8_21360 [Clostridium sp. WILCCON 0269]|uniref:Uncharacterized protein n=1 Tax=Candidatus Clostridium eludens TaxID=3381663 RepID=A0ABW8SQT4_9CLOT
MRINSITKANDKMYRNWNNEYQNKCENKREKNDKNDILFCDILKKNILQRVKKNSVNIMKY